MKNLYISLSFMLAAQFAMAQGKETEKADKTQKSEKTEKK